MYNIDAVDLLNRRYKDSTRHYVQWQLKSSYKSKLLSVYAFKFSKRGRSPIHISGQLAHLPSAKQFPTTLNWFSEFSFKSIARIDAVSYTLIDDLDNGELSSFIFRF